MFRTTWLFYALHIIIILKCNCILNSAEDVRDSGEQNNDDSTEIIGASVTQISRHPYVASLLRNDVYLCSAVILNTYWLLTVSKCFDPSLIKSYATYSHLKNFTIRVGSSYNNKGGNIYKMRMMMHNFDMRMTATKVHGPMAFNSRVGAVQLPNFDENISLGYLVSIVGWTPNGHMRLVNAPAMEPSICESYTKLRPGLFICVGGVQDPDRHFCRKDNGGAVIQNNTLVGISNFVLECAHYGKVHAFPKISSLGRWIDSTIWDEDNRPTTVTPRVMTTTTRYYATVKITQDALDNKTDGEMEESRFNDPRKFLLTLPFDPINVPLEPAEDNSVIPRMSMYESYIQKMSKARTSTKKPHAHDQNLKKEWLKRMNKGMYLPMPYPKKYDQYEYN